MSSGKPLQSPALGGTATSRMTVLEICSLWMDPTKAHYSDFSGARKDCRRCGTSTKSPFLEPVPKNLKFLLARTAPHFAGFGGLILSAPEKVGSQFLSLLRSIHVTET